jgi:poly(beta-D-mannuronate) C5 epimerase
LDKETTDGG